MNKPTLVVLAAGMGSRYGGLKQLEPMGPGGETLLDYSIHDAALAGFGDVVFVIRRDFEERFREVVLSRYEDRLPVSCAYQELDDLPDGYSAPPGRTKPWGTAHAVWASRTRVRSPFLAINADDFYGADAYRLIARHLETTRGCEFAMAAYRLRNTLSPHGSVARGVCAVDSGGWLEGVREFTKIEARGEGAVHTDPSGGTTEFSGDEPVSLNFWGFTPEVFPLLSRHLASFLDCGDLAGECYIPTAVAEMIAGGLARVRALETRASWFGVTYQEDRAMAAGRLAALTEEGVYPSPLIRREPVPGVGVLARGAFEKASPTPPD